MERERERKKHHHVGTVLICLSLNSQLIYGNFHTKGELSFLPEAVAFIINNTPTDHTYPLQTSFKEDGQPQVLKEQHTHTHTNTHTHLHTCARTHTHTPVTVTIQVGAAVVPQHTLKQQTNKHKHNEIHIYDQQNTVCKHR